MAAQQGSRKEKLAAALARMSPEGRAMAKGFNALAEGLQEVG